MDISGGFESASTIGAPMRRLLGSVLTGNGSVISEESPVPRPAWLPDWVRPWAVELFASLVVIVLSVIAARLAVRVLGRRVAKYIDRTSLTRVVLGGLRAAIYVFGFLTVLRIYGLSLGNIALSVTVFSAVVGVILAPIVGSVISGVFLLADQPYEIGDMIELADTGTRGFVDDITLRYTKVFTLDNTFLVVPNGEMRGRDVINYSAEDTRARVEFGVVITYDSDIEVARQRLETSARETEGVITGGPGIRIGAARYPAAPESLLESFGDDGIELAVRYWISEPYRLRTIQSAVRTNVWSAFDRDDAVEIAYPHRHHVFDETSGQLSLAGGGPEGGVELFDGGERDGR